MNFYLSGDDFHRSSIFLSKLTGLHTLQPCHGLGEIEEEAAHVYRAPVNPTLRAGSLRVRSWRLTDQEVREREDSEEKIDEGAHRFMFERTLNLIVKFQDNIAEMTEAV